MEMKMESATNSPESEYYSLPGDSEAEEEPTTTTTIKRKPLDIEHEAVIITPGILGSIIARFDSDKGLVPTATPEVRTLLCLNAARVMLGQASIGGSSAELINRFKGSRLLNLILAIYAEWPEGPDLDVPELLALPLFEDAMEEVEHERLPCSLEEFGTLLEEIAERPSVAVISGNNDTITILSLCKILTDTFIVFNPRCRKSPDMMGMSFRLFTDKLSTVKHVQNLISIYKSIIPTHSSKLSASSISSSGSSGPMASAPIHNMFTAWIFIPAQYINVGGHLSKCRGSSSDGQALHGSQKTIFEANMMLLKHKVELNNAGFDTRDLKRELKNLERSLEIEEEWEKRANEGIMTYEHLIQETEDELKTIETVVAMALENGVSLVPPKSDRDYDRSKREAEPPIDGIYPWDYSSRRGYDNPYTSSSKGKRRDIGERQTRDTAGRQTKDDTDTAGRQKRGNTEKKARGDRSGKDKDGDSYMRDDYGEGESIPFQPLRSSSTQSGGTKPRSHSRQYETPYSYGPGNGSYGSGGGSYRAGIGSHTTGTSSHGADTVSYGASVSPPTGADETIEKWRRQTSMSAGDNYHEGELYEMSTPSAASREKRIREEQAREKREQRRDEPNRHLRKEAENQGERRNVTFEIQTQLTEDDESRLLALALAEEEERGLLEFQRLQEMYKTFECPICGDMFDQGDAAQAERCEHVVCRGCMLGHIKAQIEEAHWPIFCGMCTNDLANRGVVTRRVAEMVGANEDLIVGWNRMELGGVSVTLECPRCRESARVDSEDFREAELLDCPLHCGAHWCKNCHQEVERGQKHSCDGQVEMDNLAQQQGWKRCPGCHTYVMKNGGCNQLSCKTPGCNMHFCYVCGGKIAQTASLQEMAQAKTAHYQTCKLW